MDNLLLIGVNHKVAPVALRERLAFNTDGISKAVKTLQDFSDKGTEIAMISTCNRTEIILCSKDPNKSEEIARNYLNDAAGFPENILNDVFYVYCGCDAVRHIMQVASGLDSLVIGENEIQSQVRSAHELALKAKTIGPILDALFRTAIHTGKRIRAETEIGKTRLSIASVIVELAQEQLGDLKQNTALLIGAGKISTLTAQELVRVGLRCVLVTNRTYDRANELVKRLNTEYASAVHFEKLDVNLEEADIVICSTGAPHFVLHKKVVESAMANRPTRPLIVADLAIPRDADPDICSIPNVQLFTLDDLSKFVQKHRPITMKAWQDAKDIIEVELADYSDWCGGRQVVPIIQSMQANANEIVQTEVERTLRRIGPISTDHQIAIEYMGKAIANKMLHKPFCYLKNQPDVIQNEVSREIINALFSLGVNNGDPLSGDDT